MIDTISEKMIRRHPHVFSGVTFESDEARHAAWEEIKAKEKAGKEWEKSYNNTVGQSGLPFFDMFSDICRYLIRNGPNISFCIHHGTIILFDILCDGKEYVTIIYQAEIRLCFFLS